MSDWYGKGPCYNIVYKRRGVKDWTLLWVTRDLEGAEGDLLMKLKMLGEGYVGAVEQFGDAEYKVWEYELGPGVGELVELEGLAGMNRARETLMSDWYGKGPRYNIVYKRRGVKDWTMLWVTEDLEEAEGDLLEQLERLGDGYVGAVEQFGDAEYKVWEYELGPGVGELVELKGNA